MPKTVELTLFDPLYNGTVTKLTFREPTAREYIEVGDPYQLARSPQGAVYGTEVDGVHARYFRLLLVEPAVEQALNIGLADAMRAKDLIQSFFTSARDRLQSSAGGQTDA